MRKRDPLLCRLGLHKTEEIPYQIAKGRPPIHLFGCTRCKRLDNPNLLRVAAAIEPRAVAAVADANARAGK